MMLQRHNSGGAVDYTRPTSDLPYMMSAHLHDGTAPQLHGAAQVMYSLGEADEWRLPTRLAEGREVLAVVRHEVMVAELLWVDEQTLGSQYYVVGRATQLGWRPHPHEPVLAGVRELEHVDQPQQGLALQHALVRLVEIFAAEVDDADREADEDAVVPVLLPVQVARHGQVVAGAQQSVNVSESEWFI